MLDFLLGLFDVEQFFTFQSLLHGIRILVLCCGSYTTKSGCALPMLIRIWMIATQSIDDYRYAVWYPFLWNKWNSPLITPAHKKERLSGHSKSYASAFEKFFCQAHVEWNYTGISTLVLRNSYCYATFEIAIYILKALRTYYSIYVHLMFFAFFVLCCFWNLCGFIFTTFRILYHFRAKREYCRRWRISSGSVRYFGRGPDRWSTRGCKNFFRHGANGWRCWQHSSAV